MDQRLHFQLPLFQFSSFEHVFQFGAVVIWNFISRGAEIYRDVSPVDLDVKHQNEW